MSKLGALNYVDYISYSFFNCTHFPDIFIITKHQEIFFSCLFAFFGHSILSSGICLFVWGVACRTQTWFYAQTLPWLGWWWWCVVGRNSIYLKEILLGFSCWCAPSFLQGSFQGIHEVFSLSVGPWVIWSDRDIIDLEGSTKILKVTGRKLCPIVGHKTINDPKSGEQEIDYNFCCGISTFKNFKPFRKTIYYYKIVEFVNQACKIYMYSRTYSVRIRQRTIFD